MAVLIGHASIDERGKISGGAAGDQTGREVCTRAWYSKPWDYMAIYPDANVREKHARAIEQACANNNIGYNQSTRNTANTEAKKVGYVISKIKTKCNTDCSALQNLAAVAAGTPNVVYGSNGWTTSSMKAELTKAGYKIITDRSYLTSESYCVRGAIYVKAGSHTVCGLSNGSNYTKTLAKIGATADASGSSKTSSSMPKASNKPLKIESTTKAVQSWLNTYYKGGLAIDGAYGPKTKAALIKAWQKEVGGLTVNGTFDANCQTKAKSNVIKQGSKGILVTIWQAYLVCRGYAVNGIDGDFGSGCYKATVKFQADRGFVKSEQDGQVGKNTWTKAFA